MSKMESKTIFFRGAYRLSGTGIVECLEITDVGGNLNSGTPGIFVEKKLEGYKTEGYKVLCP